MKVQMLLPVSCLLGSFSKGQVVEVENAVAQSWVKSNFASLVGAPVELPPPAAPVSEPAPAPEPAPVPESPAPTPTPRKRGGRGR